MEGVNSSDNLLVSDGLGENNDQELAGGHSYPHKKQDSIIRRRIYNRKWSHSALSSIIRD